MKPQPHVTKSTIADWMALHGLTRADVVALASWDGDLPAAALLGPTMRGGGTAHDPELEHPERLAMSSLSTFFEHGLNIDRFMREVRWVSEPALLPAQAPLTLHAQNGDPVTVYCAMDAQRRHLLTLAHEFGHALQLWSAPQSFIAPIDREVAAFLAEHILLAHLDMFHPDVAKRQLAFWQQDTALYFGPDRARMLRAIEMPSRGYFYRLNYPLARSVALRLFRSGDRDLITQIFKGASAMVWALEDLNLSEDRIA